MKFLIISILVGLSIFYFKPTSARSLTKNNSVVTVPNNVKDGEETLYTEEIFIINGVSCTRSWWDLAHHLTKKGNGSGEAYVYVRKQDGTDTLIAQFSKSENSDTVVYSFWYAGAVVRYYDDIYNTFYKGHEIPLVNGVSKKLDIQFDMRPDSPWHGCTSLVFNNTGDLELTVENTASMGNMPCEACTSGIPCSTICMKEPIHWKNWRQGQKSITVYLFGVNFGNGVNSNSPLVLNAFNDIDSNNAEAATFQLNYVFGLVPPANAGRVECYGISIDPIEIINDPTNVINGQTTIDEIRNILIRSIRSNNYYNFTQVLKVIRVLNHIKNC